MLFCTQYLVKLKVDVTMICGGKDDDKHELCILCL